MPGSTADRGAGAGFTAGVYFSSTFFPVGMAVRTKTWSFHTMGEALPWPGTATFHRTFLVSSQLTGGLARGATPVATGPRNEGQLSSSASVAAKAETAVSRESAARCFMGVGRCGRIRSGPLRSGPERDRAGTKASDRFSGRLRGRSAPLSPLSDAGRIWQCTHGYEKHCQKSEWNHPRMSL